MVPTEEARLLAHSCHFCKSDKVAVCEGGLRKSGICGFGKVGGADFREEQTDWWRLRTTVGFINMEKFGTTKAYDKLSFMAGEINK